jgi:hypothetical protein
MANKQPMKLGPRYAGKLVTVIIEDTCPITRLYVRGVKTQA